MTQDKALERKGKASLEDIAIQAMGLQTDRGLLVSILPQSLHIPKNEWFVVSPRKIHNVEFAIRQSEIYPIGVWQRLAHFPPIKR